MKQRNNLHNLQFWRLFVVVGGGGVGGVGVAMDTLRKSCVPSSYKVSPVTSLY